MIRGAALVSGGGTQLQSLLDAIYFQEIPNFELVAVISSDSDSYALTRAKSAHVPGYVVEPDLFPNLVNYSLAVSNKLKDMDVDLVIVAGYKMPLGEVSKTFKNRIIGVCPSLIPSFENNDGNLYKAAFDRGLRITGATSYFADQQGDIGLIILQKAVEIDQKDTVEDIRRKVMEEAEWQLLPETVKLYCENRLDILGNKVVIAESKK